MALFPFYTRCAALIDPRNASPNARMIPEVRDDETTTATNATVTMLPKRLKNLSPIVLPFL
jgi:hypothetical protein